MRMSVKTESLKSERIFKIRGADIGSLDKGSGPMLF